jgi:isopentenyl diphosphate isomerase/L-lactate dehydrogenase-like FMN-dependent dehydrogenase
LVKGILTAEDAIAALDAGMNGVIVSNHGGRQLDGAVASLDALTEVRSALGDDATVLMDGGVRRGTDVVKALAAGANAVLVGRPFMYGLAVAGRGGVEAVLGSLIDDIDRTFALVGARDVGSIGRPFIVEASG